MAKLHGIFRQCSIIAKDAVPPYDREKISVPVQGAGGWAERGFIGNHYAQEQLTGAIVSGWQPLRDWSARLR